MVKKTKKQKKSVPQSLTSVYSHLGSLVVLEPVIIARRPQEATLEGLVDVEVVTRQDMEEPVALEEVKFKLTGWAVVNPKNI